MAWLWDVLTGTPRYQGKNCWQWAQALQDGSMDKTGLSTAFRAMGTPAAGSLIELFGKVAGETNNDVADILAGLGPDVIPQLFDAYLHHRNQAVRHGCGVVMQKLGYRAASDRARTALRAVQDLPKAILILLRAMSANQPPGRSMIGDILDIGTRAVGTLVDTFRTPEPAIHAAAVEVLTTMRRRLGDIKDGRVHQAPQFDDVFARELLRLGRAGQPAVPTLMEKVGDGGYFHDDVQWVAGEVLRHIAPSLLQLPVARAAMPALLQRIVAIEPGYVIMGSQVDSRSRAIGAMKTLDRIALGWAKTSEADSAVPALVKELLAGDPLTFNAAWLVLDRIDSTWGRRPQAQAGVPALIEKLTAEGFCLPTVAEVLDRITPAWPQRPEAHALLPELLVVASRHYLKVGETRRILDAIDPAWPCLPQVRAIVPILIRKMAGADDSDLVKPYAIGCAIQEAATNFLNCIDPAWHRLAEAQQAGPALLEKLVKDGGTNVTIAGILDRIDALWRQKNGTLACKLSSLVPSWATGLCSYWPHERANALKWLVAQARGSADALAALGEAALKNENAEVRVEAVKSLAGGLDLVPTETAASLADWKEVVTQIEELNERLSGAIAGQDCKLVAKLRDERDGLRNDAILATLRAACADPEQPVREAAVQALGRIEQARQQAEAGRRGEAHQHAEAQEREQQARQRPAGKNYCCSVCGQLAKPVPPSSARLLLLTADQLAGVLFECKSCRKRLCGRCALGGAGASFGVFDRCPLCEGPLGPVENVDPGDAARLEFGGDEDDDLEDEEDSAPGAAAQR
jgi:hypothetical protein